jgi:hypothetical protein
MIQVIVTYSSARMPRRRLRRTCLLPNEATPSAPQATPTTSRIHSESSMSGLVIPYTTPKHGISTVARAQITR